MKKLLVLLALCLVTLAAGCTLTETPMERNRRIVHMWDIQSKMMVEDIDYFLLLDRSSNLSEWHTYVGK
ncbi:MAG: hypothetical protein BWX88_03664 [Planctomycetes bacterium ADurb.Bin126]|nr:MAG: hypothetical protein BWX88_03664 [Planctomycetes bacterium ADurb.Bin126]